MEEGEGYQGVILSSNTCVCIAFRCWPARPCHVTRPSLLPLQFYVVEHSMETIARHMLFLTLITEPAEKLGLQGRSWRKREELKGWGRGGGTIT